MKWRELIKERSSIRSYKDKKVDEKLLEQVRQYMKELSPLIPEQKTEILLLGKEAGPRLEGIVGYMGNAFFAPNYILLLGEDSEEGYIHAGYLDLISIRLLSFSGLPCPKLMQVVTVRGELIFRAVFTAFASLIDKKQVFNFSSVSFNSNCAAR